MGVLMTPKRSPNGMQGLTMPDSDNIRLISKKPETDKRVKRKKRYALMRECIEDAMEVGHSKRTALSIALFEVGEKNDP